jgi:hypothetical protein
MQMPTNDTTCVSYNAVYAPKRNRFSLPEAIALHARLENDCDALIQAQDALIRAVTRRCQSSPDPAPPVEPGLPRGAKAQRGQPIGLPHEAFAPIASSEFVLRASPDEAKSIETREFEIAQLRQSMRKVEEEIETYSPATPSDIAMKLKFLSALLVDGGEVDLDAFARLAEISAGILLDALETSGFF